VVEQEATGLGGFPNTGVINFESFLNDGEASFEEFLNDGEIYIEGFDSVAVERQATDFELESLLNDVGFGHGTTGFQSLLSSFIKDIRAAPEVNADDNNAEIEQDEAIGFE
jgi:hypothetical protein